MARWDPLLELRFESALPDHTDSGICVGVDPDDAQLKLSIRDAARLIEDRHPGLRLQ